MNYKDTKTKCRLYWCRVYRLEIQSVMWDCLSNLLSISPPPLPCVHYIQTVCAWGGGWGVGGVELCWRPCPTGV